MVGEIGRLAVRPKSKIVKVVIRGGVVSELVGRCHCGVLVCTIRRMAV